MQFNPTINHSASAKPPNLPYTLSTPSPLACQPTKAINGRLLLWSLGKGLVLQGWFQGPPTMGPPYGKLPILYHSHKNGTLKIWEWYGKLPIRGSHCWGSLKNSLYFTCWSWMSNLHYVPMDLAAALSSIESKIHRVPSPMLFCLDPRLIQ